MRQGGGGGFLSKLLGKGKQMGQVSGATQINRCSTGQLGVDQS